MSIIDSQVHAFGPPDGDPRWDPGYGHGDGNAHKREAFRHHIVTAGSLLSMMDAVGVDAAILVQPPMYGWSNTYSLQAAARHPDRFGVVGLLDPDDPQLEASVEAWRERMLAFRVIAMGPADRTRLQDHGFDHVFDAAERFDVPVTVFAPGLATELADLARRFPQLQMIVDHLGLPQPPFMDIRDDPFEDLDGVLALADFDNVAVKCTAVPTLSSQPYPFRDIWPHIERTLERFGPERVMWGTDITRVLGMHTYCEAVSYMGHSERLSEAEKSLIMGENARRLFRWQPDPRP